MAFSSLRRPARAEQLSLLRFIILNNGYSSVMGIFSKEDERFAARLDFLLKSWASHGMGAGMETERTTPDGSIVAPQAPARADRAACGVSAKTKIPC
jgi:hypothetical protein